MRKRMIKKQALAVLTAAAIIASCSFTAYAGWHLLNPAQVAKEAGDDTLAEAFQGKDAISINESQTYGDYKITLNGMISGKAISSQMPEIDGELQSRRTYAVISIQKKDDSPMPRPDDSNDAYEKEPFHVSPFIQGQRTDRINIYTMNGGIFTCTKDGVQYKLVDCDSLEVFADRKVYLGVTDTSVLDNTAYEMDESTGLLSRTEKYSGVNALFTLPLDEKKADSKKAEAQLKAWLEPVTGNDTEISFGTDSSKISKFEKRISHMTPEQVEKECVYLEELTQNAKPDREGMVHFAWEHKNSGGDGSFNASEYFKKKKAGTTMILGYSSSEDDVYIELSTKEKDGTYTIKLYYKDFPEED